MSDYKTSNTFPIVFELLDQKKVGEITRPFRYDLSQIPYDFTVEVRNGFKGRDVVQEAVIKPSPKK